MKSYVIIGLGRFGTRVALKLYEFGEDVLVIDTDESLINKIADKVSRAVTADAKNKDILKSLGVAHCDCAIVALGSDLASSVLVTMNLKALGVPQIICKASGETHKEILEKLGADQVIIPERVVADKFSEALVSPNLLEFIQLSDDYGMVEYKAPSSWVNKTIKELNVRAAYNVNIIGLKDNGKMSVVLSPDTLIKESTILILMGNYKALDAIKKIK